MLFEKRVEQERGGGDFRSLLSRRLNILYWEMVHVKRVVTLIRLCGFQYIFRTEDLVQDPSRLFEDQDDGDSHSGTS